MKSKIIGIFVCMLLICTVLPVSGSIDVVSTSMPVSSGNTLYVGGSGPNNYTKIQDAIKDSSDGDIVFVYDDSSPYCENLRVNKAINLIGEDRNTTEINGHLEGNVVIVKSDGATVSGFTVMHSEDAYLYTGIQIFANDTVVTDNIVKENSVGIEVYSHHQYDL